MEISASIYIRGEKINLSGARTDWFFRLVFSSVFHRSRKEFDLLVIHEPLSPLDPRRWPLLHKILGSTFDLHCIQYGRRVICYHSSVVASVLQWDSDAFSYNNYSSFQHAGLHQRFPGDRPPSTLRATTLGVAMTSSGRQGISIMDDIMGAISNTWSAT